MRRVASGIRWLRRALSFAVCGVAAAMLPAPASAQGVLAMYCSSPNTAWCQGMASGFEKASGVKVSVTQKATGELFAQIKAEGANPKGDIWWAGPGDAFLQAAEEGLLETYRSPNLGQLHDWARREAELSQYRVAGVYGGILALGYNTEVFARKKLPVPKCWKDLTDPVYKGEVMLSNPNSSGTSYMMLATLVQIFGEDEAFRYMKALNANVNQYARSGIGPMAAVIRGESGIGSTVLHGVINEIVRGFPVKPILPCEGVGYEVGSMAIIKGARNLDNAKKFFDWALTPEAQQIGLDIKEYAIPTNRAVPLPPQVPSLTDIKLINYDTAKFGAAAERRRLLERWEREINSAAK
ncbi:MAG TPA: ABC transporter substrate-binding protein [Casimicrobiaceae bacterium]|jgi:iron(III) transport system substrate-binding protein|nr:ABC transporter substrate-binding protein [Casimicrobiaceae bacterium]